MHEVRGMENRRGQGEMEWLLTAASAVALLGLFALTETARRRGLRAETTRRFAHAAGAGVAALFPLYLQLRDVLFLATLSTAFLLATWWHDRLGSIHAVTRPTAGALIFPIGLALAAVVAWPHPRAFAFAALVLALADPAAAIAGERLRGPAWRLAGSRKTLSGSLAFFVVSAALGLMFAASSSEMRPMAAVVVAAALTAIEGCLGYGLDNLPLPVAAAILGETLLSL